MNTLTLAHLLAMCTFAGLLGLLLLTAETDSDEAVLSLYATAAVSALCNLNGDASVWVSDYAMAIARHESLALGLLLALPYWAGVAATSLFALAVTGILVHEGLLGVADLARLKRRVRHR